MSEEIQNRHDAEMQRLRDENARLRRQSVTVTPRFTIDNERFKRDTESGPKVEVLDFSKFQLSAHAQGTSGMLPLKRIDYQEFPMVVYRHPVRPYKEIVHRNAQHEVVHIEKVAAEHLTKVVQNQSELETALKQGWVREMYLQQPLPDPNADLYGLAPEEMPAEEPLPAAGFDNGITGATEDELVATHGEVARRGRKRA